MRFLGFRLFAPLASFGDVAVGERRPSLTAPTRSMVLGLLGACLGVRRDDAEGQAELERSLGVATRTDAPGRLLVDYHTAQAPDGTRLKEWARREGRPPGTRREELSANFDRKGELVPLDTKLSSREYRCDAAFAVCVWVKAPEARWSLEDLVRHLRAPVFVPYAGRKGAPLALPFEPTLIEAAHPVAALRDLRFRLDDTLRPVLAGERERVYRWEQEWPGLTPARTETRRDRIGSRARWQFLPREEHVCSEPLAEPTDSAEGTDVPQSDRAGA